IVEQSSFSKPTHQLDILGMGSVAIGLGFGVDPSGPNAANRISNVVGPETTCQNHRDANGVDNPATDAPVVGDTERPDLVVERPIAIQQDHIGDSVVALRNRDALLPGHGYAPHDLDSRQSTFKLGNICRRDQVSTGPEVND